MGFDALIKRYFPAVLCGLIAFAAYFQASGMGQLVVASVALGLYAETNYNPKPFMWLSAMLIWHRPQCIVSKTAAVCDSRARQGRAASGWVQGGPA